MSLWASETARLVRLAAPALLAQVSMVSMGLVDTVMTGRVSTEDMAAVALAGSLWVPLVLFLQGILLAITPLMAQARGGERDEEGGEIFRQGLWMAAGMSLLLGGTLYGLSHCLGFMGVEGQMEDIAARYMRALIWGAPAFLAFAGMACGMEGLGLMRPVMVAGFVGLFVNIPCNYVLIFGKMGFPALGGVGAGYATAFAYWVMFLVMHLYALRLRSCRRYLALKAWTGPHLESIRQIVRIGLPGALAVMVETSFFAGVALLLAPLGAVVVAGNQVAMNIISLVFMLPLSLGIAATVQVGFGVGQASPEAVRVTIRCSLLLALGSACLSSAPTFFLRETIAGLYTEETEVVALASGLLVYAAINQWCDAVQAVSVGILRGFNDTKAIFRITLLAYWVLGLPFGYLLGRTDSLMPALGAPGFWVAFIVGIGIAAVLYLRRVRKVEARFAAKPSDFLQG